MRKGLKLEEIKFQNIERKLQNIKEFSQVIIREYKELEQPEGYFVEALIYPSDYAYQRMDGERGDGPTDVAVYMLVQEIVNAKLKFSGRKSRVNRVIMLDKVM